MSIVNSTTLHASIATAEVQCVFENGDQGSDLRPFTGDLPAGGQLPVNADSQYVEAQNSGRCWFERSELIFSLTLTKPDRTKSIGKAGFVTSLDMWNAGGMPYDESLDVTLEPTLIGDRQGDQDVLELSIHPGKPPM